MNRTFTMIKPDAVASGHTFKILQVIETAGFKIIGLKKTRLSIKEAQAFYAIHADKPFYQDLVDFMTSGSIYAAVLEKDNAILDYRKLIGATNPQEAEKETIRAQFAKNKQANAVHGSDSDENAILETSFFFTQREMC